MEVPYFVVSVSNKADFSAEAFYVSYYPFKTWHPEEDFLLEKRQLLNWSLILRRVSSLSHQTLSLDIFAAYIIISQLSLSS